MLRFLDTRLEEMLGALLLAVMVTIAFVNVVVRYCTPFSFAWTEELTINFFVWIVLLGSARSFRDGSHLGMSILYDALPKSLRFCCSLLSMALCRLFRGLGLDGLAGSTGRIRAGSHFRSAGRPCLVVYHRHPAFFRTDHFSHVATCLR